ncbi:MAG TPA: sigma-70 family RNA polymerase sigma factor, partial [Planctomycetota bacterium]
AWVEQVERYLLKRLGSRVMAADIAQEAAARLLLQVRTGRPPVQPRGWIFRTARNLALDEIRRHLPSPLGLEALGLVPDLREEPRERSWMVEALELTQSELLIHLPNALAALPEHYSRVIRAHYHEGLDCAAVAEREQLTLANTKVRLHRARRRLRQLLVSAQPGPPAALRRR